MARQILQGFLSVSRWMHPGRHCLLHSCSLLSCTGRLDREARPSLSASSKGALISILPAPLLMYVLRSSRWRRCPVLSSTASTSKLFQSISDAFVWLRQGILLSATVMASESQLMSDRRVPYDESYFRRCASVRGEEVEFIAATSMSGYLFSKIAR